MWVTGWRWVRLANASHWTPPMRRHLVCFKSAAKTALKSGMPPNYAITGRLCVHLRAFLFVARRSNQLQVSGGGRAA
eukprot:363665-Chlamydomonas_euryale.AAC.12